MLTGSVAEKILSISDRLGIQSDWLIKLIQFESGFNPVASNPYSSAKGLIQFTDATAQSLGFYNSQHLIDMHPTVESQLQVVEEYLYRFYPFNNKQDLYMSVFYPKYRKVSPFTFFPENVQAVNPGIKTVQDYIDKVDGSKSGMASFAFLVGAGAILFIIYKLTIGR